MPRSRPLTLLLLLVTIALGLASRRFPAWQPAFVATYAGDALWAAMMFWLLALARPRAATWPLGLMALGIAFAVEMSQLYRAPWLDAIRGTRLGALALGQGFLWSDLVCYAAGVAAAVVLDRVVSRARTAR